MTAPFDWTDDAPRPFNKQVIVDRFFDPLHMADLLGLGGWNRDRVFEQVADRGEGVVVSKLVNRLAGRQCAR
jgi:hypothetical protein